MTDTAYVSHADLGGTLGHGPVDRTDDDGQVFHHDWEARALALTIAAGAPGGWNIDMSRRARETLPGYADLSYFEIWTAALEQLAIEHGLVTADELAAGSASAPGDADRRAVPAERMAAGLRRGGPSERPAPAPAGFAVGDRVRTRHAPVPHHSRLPGYVANRVGVIESIHGAHVLPDTNAHGEGEQPTWLYTVVFDAAGLWPDGAAGHRVSVDAWESYLRPAADST